MPEQFITHCDIVKLHNMKLDDTRNVLQIRRMAEDDDRPFAAQGRRLRLLRQAERIDTALAFAAHVGWNQSGVSQFETGKRQVPAMKARQLAKVIPGFDPLWLWDGVKTGLSFDLRRRIEAEEAKEAEPESTRDER